VLSKNKILKVTPPAGNNGNGSNGQNNNGRTVITDDKNKNSGSQTIKSLNEQAIKDAENAHSFG